MIRVRSASRLHFGLINARPAPDDPTPHYGGAGAMIEQPALAVSAEPAECWHSVGPLAERTRDFAERFTATLPTGALAPQRITVGSAPPEHAGFGVGTQLGLAVAAILARAAGLELSAPELARRVGRGRRSAIGIHGFALGGFILDSGRLPSDDLGQLALRLAFPAAWRFVIAVPRGLAGVSGTSEERIFASPAARDLAPTLARLATEQLAPAIAAADFVTASATLGEYNYRAGEPFAAEQGGHYASPAVAALVERWRRRGFAGAGQSSWGPAVFALVADADRAMHEAAALADEAGERVDVWVTGAANHGVEVTEPK